MMKIKENALKKIARDLKIDTRKIPLSAFKKGVAVEMEHGKINPKTDVTSNNLLKTGKIALAHLEESKDYYDKLAKMEKTFPKKLGKKAKRGKKEK